MRLTILLQPVTEISCRFMIFSKKPKPDGSYKTLLKKEKDISINEKFAISTRRAGSLIVCTSKNMVENTLNGTTFELSTLSLQDESSKLRSKPPPHPLNLMKLDRDM